MLGAESVGDGFGELQFAVRVAGEAHGKGLDPIAWRAEFAHGGDDQAAVQTTRQEGADRHVGDHPLAHRVHEEVAAAADQFGVIDSTDLPTRRGDLCRQLEVAPRTHAVLAVELKPGSRFQLAHAPTQAVVAIDGAEPQGLPKRVLVQVEIDERVLKQRLQLTPEHQHPG